MSRRIVVVGDVLLDRDLLGTVQRVCPDAPVPVVDVTGVRESPGGAGLTALLCTAADTEVVLVAPVAADDAGARLARLLRAEVELVALPHAGGTRRKTRVRCAGQSLLRLDDGGPGTPVDPPLSLVSAALAGADVVLVADYGGGTTHHAGLRALLAEAAARRPLVWDPHPRGGAPVPGTALVTPNRAEAAHACAVPSTSTAAPSSTPDALAVALRTQWQARAVCVTAGSDGAYLALSASEPMYVPAPVVAGGDPCGAGDRFAASAALSLAHGAVLSEAVVDAVADASAWVRAGGAAGYRARPPQPPAADAAGLGPVQPTAAEVVARVRARGGTVVATGGCFDLVHAGHVACLEAARRLGDALVVLLNSDESVRRLKGPSRPVVTQDDRARVLQSLASVDAVAVFTEDDPRAALAQLRPDVWAKGGDYGGTPLPETALVRSWGGRVVLLPYLDGRSTTALLAAQPSSQPNLEVS
ncbi:PfkB family carbohydrate kinase [Rhodococcus sp. X156]|uniref:PfkB family carbohydrate kinase n=1 Tax=Rhodococcus sp. X156 TaxID=2499145 RepID=UPI000FDA03FF|nr:PfkB family carbohydrate kinase [Rhodococcus sp. X156]